MIKNLISLTLLFAMPNFVHSMYSNLQSNTYGKKLDNSSYEFKNVIDFSFRHDDSSALVITYEGKVLLVDFSIRTNGLLDPETVTKLEVVHDFNRRVCAAKIDPEHRYIFLQFEYSVETYLYTLEDDSLKEIEELKGLAWNKYSDSMVFSKKFDKKFAIHTGVIDSSEIYSLLDLEYIDKISIFKLSKISDISKKKKDMYSSFIFDLDSDLVIFNLESLRGIFESGVLNFEDLQNVLYKSFCELEPKASLGDFVICTTQHDDGKLVLTNQNGVQVAGVDSKVVHDIRSICLSPDQKMAVGISIYDTNFELWNLSDINNISSQFLSLAESGSLCSSEFSPDGKLIAMSCSVCFYFYDIQMKKIKTMKKTISCFEFSPEGNFVCFWDFYDRAMLTIIDLNIILNDASIAWTDIIRK